MSKTPFKMKGWSGYVGGPLRQDDTPEWSMSNKHYKDDVGYGHRVKGDGYATDNRYFYTPATKENPHGTREEMTNFDKILHKMGKLKNYIQYDIRGKKRPGEIEKEEIEEIKTSIGDNIREHELQRFLRENPFD
tara:strand:- start:629 stop:1030 length:402 start_codon:yes stop_codon:yes gene_type:complete